MRSEEVVAMATTLFCHRDQEDLEPAAFAVLDLRAGAFVRKRRVPGDKGPGLPCRGVMAGPCPEESVGKTFQGRDTGLNEPHNKRGVVGSQSGVRSPGAIKGAGRKQDYPEGTWHLHLREQRRLGWLHLNPRFKNLQVVCSSSNRSQRGGRVKPKVTQLVKSRAST